MGHLAPVRFAFSSVYFSAGSGWKTLLWSRKDIRLMLQFLKTMSYLNMVLYKNERFPFSCLMQVKTFTLFQPKFSLWLAKDLVTEGLQGRVKLGKCCSWLISCEIIMSNLMKPTEKFVQYLHICIQLHLWYISYIY